MASSPAVRFRFFVLAVFLVLFVPAGILAKQAMASLFITAAILLLGGLLYEKRRLPLPGRPVLAAFVVIALLAVAGPILAGIPVDAGRMVTKLAMLGLVLLTIAGAPSFLEEEAVRRLAMPFALSLCLGALILVVELSFDAPLYRLLSGKGADVDVAPSRFNRGGTALVLLVWPAAAALWLCGQREGQPGERQRVFAPVLLLTGFAAALSGQSASAALAAVTALLLLPLAVLLPRFLAAALFTAAAILMLAAPWIFVGLLEHMADHLAALPPSFAERLEIWHAASRVALEAPLLGGGIGATRVLEVPEAVRAGYVFFKTPTTHPHNAAVQIWLEFGLPGLLAALFLLWKLVGAILGLARPVRAAALPALAGGLVVASVSYGLWQETWLAIIGTAGLCFAMLRAVSQTE